MNFKEYLQRILAARKKDAADIETRIKASEDVTEVRDLGETLKSLGTEIQEAEEQLAALDESDDNGNDGGGENGTSTNDRNLDPNKFLNLNNQSPTSRVSLGQHFINSTKEAREKRGQRFQIGAPDYVQTRANTDPHTTGGVTGPLSHLLIDVDPNLVTAYRRPTISDLFNWGTITRGAIQYFIEGGREGNFTTVAEGGLKPQIKYGDPTPVVETLKKIAAFIKITDEMFDDLPFIVSEINGRLLYDLTIFEEYQLLKGNGSGTNLLGLYNRSGIQTLTSATVNDNIDVIFKTKRMIANETGLQADGLIINPADYETFRLSKDANGQYFGGGFFSGAYGNGGIIEEPSLWGIRTVVTPMIDQGTVMVGSFRQGATPYRKGGVSVESTNSNEDDFIHNMVTVRAEERIALAVRRPAAFVKVALAEPEPGTD
jgi:HK97 family phage major capsid protein